MKLAICISGLDRGNSVEYVNTLRSHFPSADFFFSTWTGMKTNFPNTFYFPEPEMHYHPILDVQTDCPSPKWKRQKTKCKQSSWKNRLFHHTKQIIGHAHLVDAIPEEYDMIIRSRYDTYISPRVDFSPWLDISYNENCAVGIGMRAKRHSNVHELKVVPKEYPKQDGSTSNDWAWWVSDPLIFHPRKLLDTNNVHQLHANKKLRPCEFGWYQVLSEPHNNGEDHYCVYGGAQIEKFAKRHGTI